MALSNIWPFKTSRQVGTQAPQDEVKAKRLFSVKKKKKLSDNIPFLVILAGAVCLKELLKDGTLPLCPWMGERDESQRVSPQPR